MVVGSLEFDLGQWLITSGINGKMNMWFKGHETNMTHEANNLLNKTNLFHESMMKVAYVTIFLNDIQLVGTCMINVWE